MTESRQALLIVALVVLSLSCSGVRMGGEPVQPGRSVVLPPPEAEAVLRLCSRAGPEGVEGTWSVPAEIVERLESELYKLSRLRATECCLVGARVRQPGEFYRQYVGVVIEGRRLVYINAFASSPSHLRWKESAVSVCDGGSGYWGALYDPFSRRFFHLAINGIG